MGDADFDTVCQGPRLASSWNKRFKWEDDLMASSKRQTTMAKLTRERKVQERREMKREKKQAAREAKLEGTAGQESPDSGDGGESSDPSA